MLRGRCPNLGCFSCGLDCLCLDDIVELDLYAYVDERKSVLIRWGDGVAREIMGETE